MEKKFTFADEGMQSRGILEETKKKGRKPKKDIVGKNPIRTYITNEEMEAVTEKAGDVPLATYLRNFLREKGFFDR